MNSHFSFRDDFIANGYAFSLTSALSGWLFSPSIKLLVLYRLYSRARTMSGWAFVSRLLWRWSVRESACFISPEARIGHGLCLPHPTGIVIGEGVIIGEAATIYQNVTIGRAHADVPQYPEIGARVTIYPGSVLIGSINIGEGAVIGANSVVRTDVPPGSLAVGAPARILKV